MAIEFSCPRCDKLLKTADDKAGLTANCPGCGAVVTVPGDRQVAEQIDRSAGSSGESSPVDTDAPGQPANLAGRAEPPDGSGTRRCPMCGESIAAPARRCPFCGEDLTVGAAASGRLNPHRGGLILAFGILGWVVCFPFGIAAWIMGNHDLREMDSGRMDRGGEGLTRAGKILGIVQVCFLTTVVAIYGVIVILMLAGNVRA